MGAERSLFDGVIEMADLVKYIERIADQKCESFYMSFGMSKGASGHKTHSATIVAQTKTHKNTRQFFEGTSVRHLLEQINDFLKTL